MHGPAVVPTQTDADVSDDQENAMAFDNLKLRGVAHDIKGLMTRAGLAAELLAQHKDEHVQRQADRIARAVERVNSICQSELQPVADPSLPLMHNCDQTRDMLKSIVALAQDKHKNSGVPIAFQVTVDPLVAFTVDGLALFRVLLELVTNAARTIVEYGGSQVSIDVAPEAGFILFRLSTNGPKMSRRLMHYLYPCANSAAEVDRATNSGLATAARVTRQLGGEILLGSTKSETHALVVSIPFEPVRKSSEPCVRARADTHLLQTTS